MKSFANKEPRRAFLWFFGPVITPHNPQMTSMQAYRSYLRLYGRPPSNTTWLYPEEVGKNSRRRRR